MYVEGKGVLVEKERKERKRRKEKIKNGREIKKRKKGRRKTIMVTKFPN
jgi:hypothetical protein